MSRPELSRLKNIGVTTAEWLEAVGIHNREVLERVGAVEAFRMLRQSRPDVSLVALYALQGAILDVHWNQLPEDIKADLRFAAGEQ